MPTGPRWRAEKPPTDWRAPTWNGMLTAQMTTVIDDVYAKAAELARTRDGDAVAALIDAAGNDRSVLEQARDRYARLLHGRSTDWEATAALTLLNRAVSRTVKVDPLDWKQRWAHHRKP